ncbi:unnamed protein product [Echinostoma caproni]|uniref:4_1_CTD domain-containing protein n=1 Tax=Echinostoma caproni TaxID=27848 RepID=A0A183AEI3_9TREM|nr:unnamed protein product [Echinostoma caproni]
MKACSPRPTICVFVELLPLSDETAEVHTTDKSTTLNGQQTSQNLETIDDKPLETDIQTERNSEPIGEIQDDGISRNLKTSSESIDPKVNITVDEEDETIELLKKRTTMNTDIGVKINEEVTETSAAGPDLKQELPESATIGGHNQNTDSDSHTVQDNTPSAFGDNAFISESNPSTITIQSENVKKKTDDSFNGDTSGITHTLPAAAFHVDEGDKSENDGTIEMGNAKVSRPITADESDENSEALEDSIRSSTKMNTTVEHASRTTQLMKNHSNTGMSVTQVGIHVIDQTDSTEDKVETPSRESAKDEVLKRVDESDPVETGGGEDAEPAPLSGANEQVISSISADDSISDSNRNISAEEKQKILDVLRSRLNDSVHTMDTDKDRENSVTVTTLKAVGEFSESDGIAEAHRTDKPTAMAAQLTLQNSETVLHNAPETNSRTEGNSETIVENSDDGIDQGLKTVSESIDPSVNITFDEENTIIELVKNRALVNTDIAVTANEEAPETSAGASNSTEGLPEIDETRNTEDKEAQSVTVHVTPSNSVVQGAVSTEANSSPTAAQWEQENIKTDDLVRSDKTGAPNSQLKTILPGDMADNATDFGNSVPNVANTVLVTNVFDEHETNSGLLEEPNQETKRTIVTSEEDSDISPLLTNSADVNTSPTLIKSDIVDHAVLDSTKENVDVSLEELGDKSTKEVMENGGEKQTFIGEEKVDHSEVNHTIGVDKSGEISTADDQLTRDSRTSLMKEEEQKIVEILKNHLATEENNIEAGNQKMTENESGYLPISVDEPPVTTLSTFASPGVNITGTAPVDSVINTTNERNLPTHQNNFSFVPPFNEELRSVTERVGVGQTEVQLEQTMNESSTFKKGEMRTEESFDIKVHPNVAVNKIDEQQTEVMHDPIGNHIVDLETNPPRLAENNLVGESSTTSRSVIDPWVETGTAAEQLDNFNVSNEMHWTAANEHSQQSTHENVTIGDEPTMMTELKGSNAANETDNQAEGMESTTSPEENPNKRNDQLEVDKDETVDANTQSTKAIPHLVPNREMDTSMVDVSEQHSSIRETALTIPDFSPTVEHTDLSLIKPEGESSIMSQVGDIDNLEIVSAQIQSPLSFGMQTEKHNAPLIMGTDQTEIKPILSEINRSQYTQVSSPTDYVPSVHMVGIDSTNLSPIGQMNSSLKLDGKSANNVIPNETSKMHNVDESMADDENSIEIPKDREQITDSTFTHLSFDPDMNNTGGEPDPNQLANFGDGESTSENNNNSNNNNSHNRDDVTTTENEMVDKSVDMQPMSTSTHSVDLGTVTEQRTTTTTTNFDQFTGQVTSTNAPQIYDSEGGNNPVEPDPNVHVTPPTVDANGDGETDWTTHAISNGLSDTDAVKFGTPDLTQVTESVKLPDEMGKTTLPITSGSDITQLETVPAPNMTDTNTEETATPTEHSTMIYGNEKTGQSIETQLTSDHTQAAQVLDHQLIEKPKTVEITVTHERKMDGTTELQTAVTEPMEFTTDTQSNKNVAFEMGSTSLENGSDTFDGLLTQEDMNGANKATIKESANKGTGQISTEESQTASTSFVNQERDSSPINEQPRQSAITYNSEAIISDHKVFGTVQSQELGTDSPSIDFEQNGTGTFGPHDPDLGNNLEGVETIGDITTKVQNPTEAWNLLQQTTTPSTPSQDIVPTKPSVIETEPPEKKTTGSETPWWYTAPGEKSDNQFVDASPGFQSNGVQKDTQFTDSGPHFVKSYDQFGNSNRFSPSTSSTDEREPNADLESHPEPDAQEVTPIKPDVDSSDHVIEGEPLSSLIKGTDDSVGSVENSQQDVVSEKSKVNIFKNDHSADPSVLIQSNREETEPPSRHTLIADEENTNPERKSPSVGEFISNRTVNEVSLEKPDLNSEAHVTLNINQPITENSKLEKDAVESYQEQSPFTTPDNLPIHRMQMNGYQNTDEQWSSTDEVQSNGIEDSLGDKNGNIDQHLSQDNRWTTPYSGENEIRTAQKIVSKQISEDPDLSDSVRVENPAVPINPPMDHQMDVESRGFAVDLSQKVDNSSASKPNNEAENVPTLDPGSNSINFEQNPGPPKWIIENSDVDTEGRQTVTDGETPSVNGTQLSQLDSGQFGTFPHLMALPFHLALEFSTVFIVLPVKWHC